ncbi:uncharacterized protein FOMMEDRAFT_131786 [Fomitiporia mediterranea MF3/22]|uniref:uncharacterized protein n=1 Tax=Fomitiporia mediterranea (strain MF3/22) TaxID=694068 RepID=UPI0004408B54|nr:uncharacterized protein FOMMEDRAFT_131786 [Fomitiporia mediterranea MF3/22]EJD07049.1 hypothetical protein FOMMEDRAFT_131786 [Fomitiporia mediterranea MF3/22]
MVSENRNRDSVADLEAELYDLFTTHHESRINDAGEPAVPAHALVDVLRVFGEHHDGMELLADDEEARFNELVTANPGMEVTPSILLNFLRCLTEMNATETLGDESTLLEDRGREDEWADNSDSPFESARRKRTAPLSHAAAPSSWNSKRVGTTARRRSDAGNYSRGGGSDSEQSATHSRPSSRMSRRPRAPSNPVSPRLSDNELWDSPPVRSASRANSRNRYGGSLSASLEGIMSPTDRPRVDYDHAEDGDSEDSEDEVDATLGLVHTRNGSMASLETIEREEALQRSNQDLQRRVAEQDRILQNRITDHEAELERMEIALEETKSELSSSKREEKELRAKETKYIHQIQALESEIAKSQRALETAKASYQSLQKLYQEQCTESESLRNALRNRDQQYRDATEKISLHGLEIEKWQQQQDQMEHLMQSLENQLAIAREAQAQLEEQKQENLLLKETIDRLRFDMDELRNKADGTMTAEGKGQASNQGSISKSLGVELARLNSGKWPGGESTDEEDESTAVSDQETDNEGTEGEDVVQTIITRRKKKVASRAMKRVETVQYEDVKHYSDAYTQYEKSEFTASTSMQTEPEPKKKMASFSTQTEYKPTSSSSIQTDTTPVPPPVLKVETEVQTDAPEESEQSGTFVADESSSSLHLHPKRAVRDLPPSYAESSQNDEEQEQRDMRVAAEAILKWHRGLEVPLSPAPRGISDDALEEWAALKEEIGFDCLAVDKVLEMSYKTGRSRDGTRSERSVATAATDASSSSRINRLTNIYNTFVYGKPDADHDRSLAVGITQAAVVLGGCIIAAGLLNGPFLQPTYHVPGGPTYYDRAAFSQFNNLYPLGEGFAPDGAATVWDFIGRIGGEAARMARGWPS